MNHFNYKKNTLFAENVDVGKLAKEIKTPFYLYSTATLERHYKVLDEALNLPNKLICFAVKSCGNISIIKTLVNQGSGVDVVSKGEIFKALKSGCSPAKIVFSGVGKTEEEIIYGLENGIFQFNTESREEIEQINMIAGKLGNVADIALRINPNVDAKTHSKISTGKKGDKFGIDIDVACEVIKFAESLANITLKSISVHIGSQITKKDPFELAFRKTFEFVAHIEKQGITLERIDLGGGLGVPYGADGDSLDPKIYGKVIADLVKEFGFEDKLFIFEPGRLIAANAGILVTTVILIKKTEGKKFAIVDAAMNDFMRPALYDAKSEFIKVDKTESSLESYDIVGPVCETTDVFEKDAQIESLAEGDILAIRSTGAYGAVMANEYNVRPLIPEILVKGEDFSVIRERPNYDEMIRLESFADWL